MGMRNDSARTAQLGRLVPWLPHLGALLVLVLCLVDGALLYGSLPDVVPVHWGLNGPDAWEDKSFGTVFMGPLVALVSGALLALVSAAAPAFSPEEPGASEWEASRRRGMIRGTVAAMGAVSLLIAACVSYLSMQGWRTPDEVEMWPALVLSGFILAVIVPVYALAERRSRRDAAQNGIHPTAEEAADDAKWIGGVLLNDPHDPHVLVPKRSGTGTGLTVNIGHARGRTAVVLFLIVVVGLPVGLGAFAAL